MVCEEFFQFKGRKIGKGWERGKGKIVAMPRDSGSVFNRYRIV
jgi:hypothetical protein